MALVKAKKFLGQHFLKDESVSLRIARFALEPGTPEVIVELGAGMGALTKYLYSDASKNVFVIEIDRESVEYLIQNFPDAKEKIFTQDFLHADFARLFEPFYGQQKKQFTLIGNFPYNISSQILFKVLEHRDEIPLVIGMFQKEVAKRIASGPGNKTYGILSVFMQTWYEADYMFELKPESFDPPPKVDSSVLRFRRNGRTSLTCGEKRFRLVVKTGFNQRRKTLRNALKNILPPGFPNDHRFLSKRAEELSTADFEELTTLIEEVSG